MQITFEGGPMNGRTAMVNDGDTEYAFEMMPPPRSRDPNARFLLAPRDTMQVVYGPSERSRIWKPIRLVNGAQ